MLPTSVRHADRTLGSLSLLVALSLAFIFPQLSPTAAAQTTSLRRAFPLAAQTRLVIANARSISVRAWDKNEVAIVAESSQGGVEDAEVRVLAKPGRLEIACVPALTNKVIALRLQVPEKSFLEWRAFSYKVEVKEVAGELAILASRDAFHLRVPARAEVDVRDADDVLRFVRHGGGFGIIGGSGKRHFGNGPPYVKAQADGAEVLVTDSEMSLPVPEPTRSAHVIAGAKGSMGSALRKLIGVPPAKTLSAAGAQAQDRDEDEPLVKLETQLVNLNVSVMDRHGKAVSGLTLKDFIVSEEDDAQQITFFSPEQAPFNLVLLMDMSGSVRNKLDLIKEAALHFLDVIGPEDRVAVVTFTTDVQVVSPLTGDRDALRERVRELKPPSGGTSFYDALGYVLADVLAAVKGQRNAVIVITDGEDNSLFRPPALPERLNRFAEVGFRWPMPRRGSYLTFAQLLEGLLEADAIAYPIHLRHTDGQWGSRISTSPSDSLTPPPPNLADPLRIKETSRRQLQELAEASGGKLFSAERIEELKGVYEQVAAEIRTVYSLAYTPKDPKRDGSFRRVRVKLNKDGAAIRTRKGYYAR